MRAHTEKVNWLNTKWWHAFTSLCLIRSGGERCHNSEIVRKTSKTRKSIFYIGQMFWISIIMFLPGPRKYVHMQNVAKQRMARWRGGDGGWGRGIGGPADAEWTLRACCVETAIKPREAGCNGKVRKLPFDNGHRHMVYFRWALYVRGQWRGNGIRHGR